MKKTIQIDVADGYITATQDHGGCVSFVFTYGDDTPPDIVDAEAERADYVTKKDLPAFIALLQEFVK